MENLIKEAWENTTASKNYESERWKDFDKVVNRLNSPKLLYIYMMANIAYDYEKFEEDKRTGIEIPSEVEKETTKGLLPQLYTPKEVFERKKGCCYDHAHFQLYCLLQNGYAYDRFDLHSDGAAVHFNARNPERPPGYTGHHTCLYVENKLFYLIDTGRPIISKRGLKGPFVTVEEAAVAGFVTDWKAYRFFDIDMVITKTVWR